MCVIILDKVNINIYIKFKRICYRLYTASSSQFEKSRQLLNSIWGEKSPEELAISCRFSKKIHIK